MSKKEKEEKDLEQTVKTDNAPQISIESGVESMLFVPLNQSSI
jgi:hypothetical protein